jgi:hypothetical protein
MVLMMGLIRYGADFDMIAVIVVVVVVVVVVGLKSMVFGMELIMVWMMLVRQLMRMVNFVNLIEW